MQQEQVVLNQIATEGGFGKVAARQRQHEFVPGVSGPDRTGGGDQAIEQCTGHGSAPPLRHSREGERGIQGNPPVVGPGPPLSRGGR